MPEGAAAGQRYRIEVHLQPAIGLCAGAESRVLAAETSESTAQLAAFAIQQVTGNRERRAIDGNRRQWSGRADSADAGGTHSDPSGGASSRCPVKAQVLNLQSREFRMSDLEADLAGRRRGSGRDNQDAADKHSMDGAWQTAACHVHDSHGRSVPPAVN